MSFFLWCYDLLLHSMMEMTDAFILASKNIVKELGETSSYTMHLPKRKHSLLVSLEVL